jgi:hypothetical protein
MDHVKGGGVPSYLLFYSEIGWFYELSIFCDYSTRGWLCPAGSRQATTWISGFPHNYPQSNATLAPD